MSVIGFYKQNLETNDDDDDEKDREGKEGESQRNERKKEKRKSLSYQLVETKRNKKLI